jgi:hypothetical protein
MPASTMITLLPQADGSPQMLFDRPKTWFQRTTRSVSGLMRSPLLRDISCVLDSSYDPVHVTVPFSHEDVAMWLDFRPSDACADAETLCTILQVSVLLNCALAACIALMQCFQACIAKVALAVLDPWGLPAWQQALFLTTAHMITAVMPTRQSHTLFTHPCSFAALHGQSLLLSYKPNCCYV